MRNRSLAALVPVAVSFAVCGALSGLAENSDFFWWLGIPFAFLCAVLCLRKKSMGARVAGVIGYAAIWPIAYFSAIRIGWLTGNDPLGIGVAGVIGALSVTIVTLIECSSLSETLSEWKSLFTASVIGGIAAVPLALAFRPGSPDRKWLSLSGFAVWQAAVGTYLYFIYRKERDKRRG